MNDASTIPSGAEAVAWDLRDLYAAIDDPAIDRDLAQAEADAARLHGRYHGAVAGLDAPAMLDFLQEYERVRERSDRVSAYAQLYWSANTEAAGSGALLQKTVERASQLAQRLVFAELELAATPAAAMSALIADPRLERYRHWLEQVRLRGPHLLSEPEERILAEKSVTGRFAWTRFFDETHSAARYDFDGVTITRDQLLSKRYGPDRDIRRRASEALTRDLRRAHRMNAFVFNTILADKASEDRLRGYPTWIASRNLDNQVDDAIVDALVGAVTSRYDIVARYYRLKRRVLGLGELYDYDVYAPLAASVSHYPWDEGRSIVLEAFGAFHPRLAEIAGWFFDRRWIDAAVRPGKMGGAFSHGTVPSAHPYVLVNYEGTPRDVMTLAHELGHGAHQALSAQRGLLSADTPLTTAETASVFGEMLAFRLLLAREADPMARLGMLAGKIEDSIATCFRQVTMNRFEDAIHNDRRSGGELTGEQLNARWLATQRAMFGDSVTVSDDYGYWWSYVPHFVATPGYVYAYAFGELLVLALYARYQSQPDGFADAYLSMLAAGGSDWPHEIVKPLGVDLTAPGFWHEGLRILDEMVGEAELLATAV